MESHESWTHQAHNIEKTPVHSRFLQGLEGLY